MVENATRNAQKSVGYVYKKTSRFSSWKIHLLVALEWNNLSEVYLFLNIAS